MIGAEIKYIYSEMRLGWLEDYPLIEELSIAK